MQCKCDRNFISEKSRQWRDFFYGVLLNYLTEWPHNKKALYRGA